MAVHPIKIWLTSAKPESQQMRTAKLFTCIIDSNVIFYLWRKWNMVCGTNEISNWHKSNASVKFLLIY